MTKPFLLLSQKKDLVQQFKEVAKKAHWEFTQVTTATGLVVELEEHSYAGIWWDMTDVTLDTTIATMTLIRSQVNGPITVFTNELTARIQRKLYRALVDDVVLLPFDGDVLRPLIEQRLWLYKHIESQNKPAATDDDMPEVISADGWEIDHQHYSITKDGEQIELTPKEFQLLSYLIQHQGQVLSREQLVTGVWGYDILDTSRIVDIHISHLRDKLETDPHNPVHLLTVRGFGYKLV
ncbi:MAG: response regulator transcription factor [Limosilactobacillus sp.]|uniref:response regulator transcription factor n=1 Tax=Limosilactobacillus sp. TaxID=2773925 RepID=UPI00270CD413|nr:response regulator transcription factor [Limosilactobacillus sp.]